jgi:hypothetical protein
VTLNTTPPLTDYVENGVTTIHAILFQFQTADEITCWRIIDGVRGLMVQGLDYDVVGTNVVKTSGGVNAATFRVERTTSRAQTVDFAAHDDFPAEVAELGLDKRAAVEQEIEQNLTEFQRRVLRVGFAQTIGELPDAAERADHYFLWGPTGDPAVGISAAWLASLIMPVSAPIVTQDGFLRPEAYGALGDGIANDTVAFQSIAAILNAAGGGGVALTPKRIYLVGKQDDHAAAPTLADGTGVGNYRYTAQSVLSLANLNGFTFHGNGATLKTQAGLRHGAFNADGSPMASANGYQGVGAASAYGAMLLLDTVTNFAIDGLMANGNSGALNKGGPWGDTGWQVGGTGLQLNDCSNGAVSNCWIFAHPSDGAQIAGACSSPAGLWENINFTNCIMELNGRQGMSLIGGRGLSFKRCAFSFNGKGDRVNAASAHPFRSDPSAGVDVEAEGLREVHEVTYDECVFACNAGAGWLYAGGGASNHHFNDCVFIADNTYAFYKAAFLSGSRFTNCVVVGLSLWHGGDGDDPAKWDGCLFLDSADTSPTGVVYDAGRIIDFGDVSAGAVVENTRFILTGAALTPSGDGGVIYRDTTLSQADPTPVGFAGTWEGTNRWDAPLAFDGASVHVQSVAGNFTGRLFVNGAEGSVLSQLANPQGSRLIAHDGVTMRAVRIGRWYDPVGWANMVGGAVTNDLVFNTLTADNQPIMWECLTAPGNLIAHWKLIGIKGMKKAAAVSGLSHGDPLDTVIDRILELENHMRDASLLE